jgi:hypothetical protein
MCLSCRLVGSARSTIFAVNFMEGGGGGQPTLPRLWSHRNGSNRTVSDLSLPTGRSESEPPQLVYCYLTLVIIKSRCMTDYRLSTHTRKPKDMILFSPDLVGWTTILSALRHSGVTDTVTNEGLISFSRSARFRSDSTQPILFQCDNNVNCTSIWDTQMN